MKTFPHDPRYQCLIELLKNHRIQTSSTQQDVAALLGKPQSYVSKYEGGERRLDPVELYDICTALGVEYTVFSTEFDCALRKIRKKKCNPRS